MASNDMARTVIRVASRLIILMRQEIELLRAMRPSEIESLQAEKASLTTEYEDAVRRLATQPAIMASVAPALKEEVAEVIAAFKQVVAENGLALESARDVHDRLLKVIVQAAEKNRSELKGYSGTGGAPGEGPDRGHEPLSMSLDTHL